MPNSRVTNEITNSRIRNDIPNSRILMGNTGVASQVTSNFTAGMPIGLLLVLTYASDFTENITTFFGDLRPNARVI